MNRMELAKYMKVNGISDRAISFVPENDKYCLIREGTAWHIFFDERRERTFSKKFDSDEACTELLDLALKNS